jgi:hypothetical protein
MSIVKFKSLKIEHFAMLFLIVGIIVLYILSLSSNPEFVKDYSLLKDYDGEVVVTKGIVIDYDTTSRGETIVTLLEPDDLNSTLKVFIESSSLEIEIGDMIQVKGSVLKISDDFLEIVVVNEKDVDIIGHWHNYRLSIPELAHRLAHKPDEFAYLPVEVSGYLKYEPRVPITSLRLSEHPVDGLYSVKIEVPANYQLSAELHKGDLISLNTTIIYNENNFEYKLTLINLTLIQSYGEWLVTFEELIEAPFIFEGAKIELTGYVYEYQSYYNYILLFDSPAERRSAANYSLWVDITGINLTGKILHKDYFVSITGTLYYDPQYVDYAIKAETVVPG